MVQTSFNVGDAGSLATALQDISSGGTDAAIDTGYTITGTAAIFSASATVSLESGSSLTLEGSFPLIIDDFAVTGTVIADLNFTGTITLDKGVFENAATATNGGGTIIAGLYSGAILGTASDGGDSAINDGSITYGGAFAAIELDSGTIQNGWNGPASALVSGVAGGAALLTGGVVQNGGTIIASGTTSAAVFLGTGAVDNGQIGDTGAVISGGENGVEITGAGTVNNDGTITGVSSYAVYLGSGGVTNGQIGDATALINGGSAGGGVWIATGAGTVDNFGTITGSGTSGVYLTGGGTVANGASAATTALIEGASYGVLLGGLGTLLNYGTVQVSGGGASAGIGAFLEAGGTIENLATSSMIDGLEWGIAVEGTGGLVTNLGTIEASGTSGLGVDLTAGGTVVNGLTAGSAATITGTFDGVRISAGVPGAGADVQNDGTIIGAVGVDFQSGSTPVAGTLSNDGLIESTGGASGDAVVFGAGAETLMLQSAGVFIGNVLGGEVAGSHTTLELAGSTQGTLSALGSDAGTVTDSAGSFGFSAIGTLALDAGASWTIDAPGTLDTLDNAGTVTLSGGAVTETGTLLNTGTINVGGNTLTLDAAVVSDGATTGSIVIGGNGMVTLQAGADVGQTLQFAIGGTQEMLALAMPSGVQAVIADFAVGRTIDLLNTATVTGFQYTSGTLDVLDNTTTVAAFDLPGPFVTGNFSHNPDLGAGTFITTDMPCFAAGTRIATERGMVAVETLREGDRVRTLRAGKFRPITWLGQRRVDCRRHPDPKQVLPICIVADAFGPGRPYRDLFLSPDHSLYVNGVLIPIRYLVNGRTIYQQARDEVSYWHVELTEHNVLYAEGVPAESYLDTGNRNAFANGGPVMDLHADFARQVWEAQSCAPLVMDGPRLTAAKHRLLSRATALGHRTTNNPELRVLADDKEVLAKRNGQNLCVRLPEATTGVRLISRIWRPAHMQPEADDARSLGVAIAHLRLDGRAVVPDKIRLAHGWHAPEPDWHWTDGDAWLAVEGERVMEFEVVMTGTYWQEEARCELSVA